MKKFFYVYLTLIFFIIFASSGCNKRVKESQFLFNTIVDVTIISRDHPQNAIDTAFGAIKDVDRLMNLYNKDSEVANINKNATSFPIKISSDTFWVINKSIEFSELSKGAFDVSIEPLVELWGFGKGKNRIPLESELQKKMSLVNYNNIILNKSDSSIYLNKMGMKIDLGAIAVGYAVDKAVKNLKDIAIENALINAGGEIYALGSPPKKKAWKVGIQHPRRKNELLGTIDLKNKAISTSGDYENYFEENGKRYCHIINAKTGQPVNGVMSVTVIADSTIDADALSTALMLMKPEEAIRLVKNLKNVECLIITGTNEKDMKILQSNDMKDKFNLTLLQ